MYEFQSTARFKIYNHQDVFPFSEPWCKPLAVIVATSANKFHMPQSSTCLKNARQVWLTFILNNYFLQLSTLPGIWRKISKIQAHILQYGRDALARRHIFSYYPFLTICIVLGVLLDWKTSRVVMDHKKKVPVNILVMSQLVAVALGWVVL